MVSVHFFKCVFLFKTTVLIHGCKEKYWQDFGKKSQLLPKERVSIPSKLNSNSLEWSVEPWWVILLVLSTWKIFCPWMDCLHVAWQDCERLHKMEETKKNSSKIFCICSFLSICMQNRIKAHRSQFPKITRHCTRATRRRQKSKK